MEVAIAAPSIPASGMAIEFRKIFTNTVRSVNTVCNVGLLAWLNIILKGR